MKLFADILFTYCICFRYIYLGVNTIFVNQVRGISYYLSETKRDIKHHLKTRMTTFIKMKFKISDDQTNIYKYRLAGNITEFSKGIDSTQHWPPCSQITIAEWYIVAECVIRSWRTNLVGSQLLSIA